MELEEKSIEFFNDTNLRANLGDRFVAGLLDYLIIYGFTFYLVYMLGESNDVGEYTLTGSPLLIPIIFWLLMTVGLEIWIGATIGNLILGLKPIPEEGGLRNLTFIESFKRHLLDPVDMAFFGLIGIITIKNTRLHQRVGDLWGKTVVVRNRSLKEIKKDV